MAALVVGHSFVSRLQQYVEGPHGRGKNWLFGLPVRFAGFSGADIGRLWMQARRADLRSVFVVHIEIGSNDLSTLRPVDDIVHDIMSFVQWLLHERGVRRVVVGEILHRTDRARPMAVSLPSYNRRVEEANRKLDVFCSRSNNVKFKRHSRLHGEDKISMDGVHLRREVQKQLWKNIRGNLLSMLADIGYAH